MNEAIEKAIDTIENYAPGRDTISWSDMRDALILVIAAIRAQSERMNPKPLTVKELREMDRDIIWMEPMKEYRTVLTDVNLPDDVRLWTPFGAISAKHVLANGGRIYRSKPKEVSTDD